MPGCPRDEAGFCRIGLLGHRLCPEAMDASPNLDGVARLLAGHRFRLSTERALQDGIEAVLAGAGIAYRREHPLPGAGVVDFLVGRIGIEAKVGGSKRAIHRQCARYCAHADLDALVLATGVAMALPGIGKPTAVVDLGRAWL